MHVKSYLGDPILHISIVFSVHIRYRLGQIGGSVKDVKIVDVETISEKQKDANLNVKR